MLRGCAQPPKTFFQESVRATSTYAAQRVIISWL